MLGITKKNKRTFMKPGRKKGRGLRSQKKEMRLNKKRNKGTLFAKLLLNLLLIDLDYYPFSVLAAVGYLLCSNI